MLKYQDYINTPDYQNADDAGREDLRNRYWNEHLAPHIPFEQQGALRQTFDQRTAPQGNPYQGYGWDVVDALQEGFYGGAGDLASGVDYLVGGDGDNAVADYFRGKADEQVHDMSPSGRQAMQGFGFNDDGTLKESSTKEGFGLQFASGLGSFAPSMVPGGLAARGLSVAAKGKRAFDIAGRTKNIKTVADAERVRKLDKRINAGAFVAGYGVTGGAMIGAGAAEQARQTVLASGYENLKDLPRFQALYRQTYDQPGIDTRTAFNQARELLAAEVAQDAFQKAAPVGAASMGVAGPLMDKVVRGAGVSSRLGNAAAAGVIEGGQEFTEGYGQQVASNLAQQGIGMDVATTEGAMGQGLSGAVVGAPIGGGLGVVAKPGVRQGQPELQQQLTDLHSQRLTLQDQLSAPDADINIINGLLRDNAQTIAATEAALKQPFNTINLGRATRLKRAVNVDEPEMETVGDPTATPTSWQDHNPQPVTALPQSGQTIPTSWQDHNPQTATGPQSANIPTPDYKEYDRPTYQRQRDVDPRTGTRSNAGQPTPLLTTDNAIYQQPVSAGQTGSTFAGKGFEQQTQHPLISEKEPAPQNRATQKGPENQYTGNEDTDLQLYASRANGLNKVLHGHQWTEQQKPLKDQLKRVIQQRKALEKEARTSASQLSEPFTPKDIQGKLQTIQQELKAGNDFYLGDELTALERQTQTEHDQLKQLQNGQSPAADTMQVPPAEKGQVSSEPVPAADPSNLTAPQMKTDGPATENGAQKNGTETTATTGQRATDADVLTDSSDVLTDSSDVLTDSSDTLKQSSDTLKQSSDTLPNSEPAQVSAEPTPLQKEAGNYKKEHIKVQGLDISLENIKGSTRSGTDPDGNAWSVKMQHNYGYIKRTEGADGDHVDVFVGDNPDSEKVFVVDQVNKDGSFDEHKVMLGFNDRQSAVDGYKANYEKGWTVGEVTELDTQGFKQWLKEGNTRKPLAGQKVEPQVKPESQEPETKPATPRSENQRKKSLKKIAETPAAKSDRPPARKKASEKPTEKIEDFGEKIGGARKDMWASFRDAFRDDVDVAALPLSKTFPQPDYVKLSEAGIDNETLAIIAALRADFSAKPRKAHKLGRWAREVEEARDITRSLIDGEKTSAEVLEAMAGDNKDVYRKRGIAHFVPVLKRFKPEQMKLLANFRMRSGSFSMLDGHAFDGFKSLYFLESGGHMMGRGVSSETLAEAQEKAFEYLSSEVEFMGEQKGRQTSFNVFRGRTSKEFWIGKKVAAGKIIELKSGFTDSKDAFAFIKDNQQWLEDELKKKKDIPAHRRSTNHPRVGDDYRKGKDVTPEQFADAFGFRGVEFGNWVEQGKRQQDLNEAYDALHDLATVLGIPPKALSLNGELGLAFGARGRGGAKAFKAHYEPDRVVINLTKKAGPGSLAHEWWHALDNYFSREGGDQYGFVSKDGIRREYRDGQFHPSEKVRLKVQDAFKAVTQTIKDTDLPKRAKELDKTRSKDYWSTMVEMTARTFEGFVINKLDAAGMANDYLANITGPEVFADANVDYPYLLAAEAPKVDNAFADFFKILKHRKTDKGTQLYRYRTSEAKGLKQGPLKLKLAPLEKKLGFPVTVLQSETQLPSEVYQDVIRDGARGRVRGVYDQGRAFVIADNLDSVEEATRTVLHEVVGHAGVRQVAGKQLDILLDQIHRDMSDGLKKALQKRYARQLQGKAEVQVNRIIAEEYLAHLAETNPENNWVQKVIAVVRNALRRLFPNIEWRAEDVVELLSSSRRALRESGQRTADSGQRYSDSDRADTFYSAVERGAAAVKSDTLPTQSWLNAIKKHPNITDEEIQWLGLDIFLDSKKGQKLKKQEVLEYIRANRIEIEEVKYGFTKEEVSQQKANFRGNWIFEATRKIDYGHTLTPDLWEQLLQAHRDKHWKNNRERHEEKLRKELDGGAHPNQKKYIDEAGKIDEQKVYHESVQQANHADDLMDDYEVFDLIPLEEREKFAERLYEDYGADEFQLEEETQHETYSTEGGEEYTELLLTLPDNEIWYPRRADAHGEYDVTPGELKVLKEGKLPYSLKVQQKNDQWQVRRSVYQDDDNGDAHLLHELPMSGKHSSREQALAEVIEKAEQPFRKQLSGYNSSHWNETNVLAFTRFKTFYDKDNNKVLLIDEVQSDWHQQGRDNGYESPDHKADYATARESEDSAEHLHTLWSTMIPAAQQREDEASVAHGEAMDDYNDLGGDTVKDSPALIKARKTLASKKAVFEKAKEQLKEANLNTEKYRVEFQQRRTERTQLENSVPNAPLKQNWPNLVMKRMLRHAAEHGFDKVAWTRGVQQDKRYSLGRHLKSLDVQPLLSEKGDTIDSYSVSGIDHKGKAIDHPYVDANVLEDVIGNRLAAEVRAKEGEQLKKLQEASRAFTAKPETHRKYLWKVFTDAGVAVTFEGENQFYGEIGAKKVIARLVNKRRHSVITLNNLDEVVGGDGAMQAFYDNRLVNYIKKYTKKWGGKVGKVELETEDGRQQFWSVPVTDKMKDAVLRDGQAMFALRGEPTGTFKERLVKAMGSKRSYIPPVLVGNTPQVLQNLGAKDLPITIRKDIVLKATNGVRHNVEMSIIEQIPELLADPELVFTGAVDDSFAIVVNAWEAGEPVMVALHLNVRENNLQINRIASVYGKKRSGLKKWVTEGNLIYTRNEESLRLVRLSPVQFRGVVHQLEGSKPKIATAKTLVKKSVDQKDSDTDSDTRYALKSDLPGEVEDVITGIHGGIGKRRKWTQRVKEWFQEHPAVGTKKGIYQGTLDAYHSIAVMERETNNGKLLEAAQSAYKAALRTKNREGVMTALLGKGTPKLENGSVVFRDGSKGFLDVMEPVAQKGELELWETWAASKRAMRLMKEGKEHLYTPERIKTIQTYVSSMPGMEQRFQQVFDDYQTFNGQILDFAQQAGLIDPESRKLWDKGDYIPFHRVHEVGDAAGEQFKVFGKKGLSGQKSGIKQLTGGVEKISPLEAMYRNTEALIDASFKNIAMQRIADLGVDTGALELTRNRVRLSRDDVKAKLAEMNIDTDSLTPEQLKRWQALLSKFTDTGEGTVTVSRDGKPSSYQVNDPLLLDAITELGPQNLHWMLKLLSIPKQVLTQLVTADPGFMVRNLFRDTLSTWMTVHPEINGQPLKINPIVAAARTVKNKIDNDDSRWSLMMAGGGSGGFYDMNPDTIRRKLSPSEQQKIINKPGQLWDAWQKFGSRFENANRLHVFENTIKQGGSVAEAAHQAQDVLNFTRKGQWQLMNILVSALPFFNARVQGLDRLWRGATQEGKSGLAAVTPSFVLRGAMYAAASTALLAMYDDDERFTSLPEWDKLNYHHIWLGDTHYRIPKPFEVGAIFGTVPEMAWQTAMGNEDLKWAKKMAGGMIFQTLAFDPVPQAVRPALDVAMNRSSFTDMPIVPLGLQYVKPEAQYDPWTSETLKQLVKAVPEGAPDWMRSPKKLQYVLQGYFGTLGRYAIEASDVMTRQAVKAPQRPALRARDVPVVGSFVRDGVDSTRYRGELYDMQKELTDLKMTINRYKDSGEKADARKLTLENKEKLAARKGINRYAKRISSLKKQIRKIMDDRLMTARVKRDKIDALSRRVNKLSAEAVGKYGGKF